MTFRLHAQNVVLDNNHTPLTLDIGEGLTLLYQARESSASALTLALAGRYKPISGTIALHTDGEVLTTTRARFKHIALAGATEIDSLERGVTVKATLREQRGWAGRGVVAKHEALLPDHNALVGDLPVADRFRLRIALALIARPHATALLVDDIDQLRDLSLRADVLHDLAVIAQEIPVIVSTVNADTAGCEATVISLRPEEDTPCC